MQIAECVVGGRLRRLRVVTLNTRTVTVRVHYSPHVGHKGWEKTIWLKKPRVTLEEV